MLLRKYSKIYGDVEKSDVERAEIEQQKENIRLEKQAEQEHRKQIKKLKSEKKTNLDKHFWEAKALIKTVVNSDEIHSLILKGASALGKSYNTIKTLVDMGLELDEDFIVVNSYITPLELYHLFYENQDKTMIFDDIFKLFSNEKSKGLLMSALWSATEKRMVQYKSSKLDIPKKFEFKGNIIFLTNKFPDNFKALKTRCLWYDIKIPFKQRIEMCYSICKIREIPMEVMDWIKSEFNESYEINLRTPIKIYNIYKENPEKWKQIAQTQFKSDEELSIVKDLVDSAITISEKISEYKKQTGKSRRSYYRRVKELTEMRGTVVTNKPQARGEMSKCHK